MDTTSWREDLITVSAGCWLLVGAGLDARAHITSELDTFFTPWHAALYSGFAATVAWVSWLTLRRQSPGRAVLASTPMGYRLAWVGVAMFFVGGISDLTWHKIFGIERGIAAAYSPTHLLLLFGALLILSSPVRSAWARPGAIAPVTAVASMTLVTAIVALTFTYFSPLVFRDVVYSSFDPSLLYQRSGLASLLVTNVVMTVPALVLMTRWRIPLGTFTALWGFPALAVVLTNAPRDFRYAIATFAAGGATDILARLARPSVARPGGFKIVAAIAPVLLWGSYFATVAIREPVGWEPELWVGSIVWASATGLGIAQLLLVATTTSLRESDDELIARAPADVN